MCVCVSLRALWVSWTPSVQSESQESPEAKHTVLVPEVQGFQGQMALSCSQGTLGRSWVQIVPPGVLRIGLGALEGISEDLRDSAPLLQGGRGQPPVGSLGARHRREATNASRSLVITATGATEG